MRHGMLILSLCFLLPACIHLPFFQQSFRPVHATPEEAAQVEFPLAPPTEGRLVVRGRMGAAIQLAMDDFLPRGIKPHSGATPVEVCLYQRESYDVFAAPGPEGMVFVEIVLAPDACKMNGPVLDMGATYAIDVKGWRILAVKPG
ncbi:hypothetical protein [Archangium sp.]|uniref:hypothetical protein n=1 Tax=Archangium sp. TaxID=1872627 RepID=UPI002D26A1A4|nr:hypothetical protein [Archangium sp.]HYO54722.1 hypothetical protein [Archangium sp.]